MAGVRTWLLVPLREDRLKSEGSLDRPLEGESRWLLLCLNGLGGGDKEVRGLGDGMLDSADVFRHWTYLRAAECRSQAAPFWLKTWSTRADSSEQIRGWT